MGIDGILYWPGLTYTYEIKAGPHSYFEILDFSSDVQYLENFKTLYNIDFYGKFCQKVLRFKRNLNISRSKGIWSSQKLGPFLSN